MTVHTHIYHSPCGELLLGAVDGWLCICDWLSSRLHMREINRIRRELKCDFTEGLSPVITLATAQLDEYFAGQRKIFDIPLLFVGTEFQKLIWRELLTIPYGHVVSYGYLARRIGMPSAVRAVANVVGANALSIFVSCHRVIGSDRSLTGYAGGLNAKKYLLLLEGVLLPELDL